MKRLVFIGLLLLIALAACHSPQREARKMVSRAELLFDSLPDSTASLIDSVLRMPVYFNEGKRMDMALLQAEALFGDRSHGADTNTLSPLMDDDFFDDKPFLTTSPELERAAAYYAKKKRLDKAAHAALYSGFVQQHYGDKTAAMQSFKDAERYGGLAKDSLSVAWAQCLMGQLLFYDGMEKDALSLLETADHGLGKRYADRALVQNKKAVCYLVLGDNENAKACLQQSLTFAEKSCLDKVMQKVMNNYAVLYQLQGDYDRAIECLRRIADNPDLDAAKALLLYVNLGDVFMEGNVMDSAAFYYKRVESLLPSTIVQPERLLAAYNALFKFAKLQSNDSMALEYRDKHENLLYEIMRQRQEQSVYRIQRQYDYETIQNTLNRKIIHRHQIIIVISVLLLISAFIILVLQFRHKQLKEAEEEMGRQIDAMKEDLRQTVKSSVMDQEVAWRLKMILTAYRTAKQAHDPKKEWQPLVSKVMNGKASLFEAAQSTIETAYPNLYAILLEKYPSLTETEAKVCLLSFSDLSNAEMADLLGLRLNTVNQNRSTLRKKLNLKSDKIKDQLRNVLFN